MVIGHGYRYLFIEIPGTASWAIRQELCEHYGGVPILHKHASWPEFVRGATQDEASYFVVGSVRNPLDKIVSRYVNLKGDRKGVYSDPESTRSLITDYSDHRKYEFVRSPDTTFRDFFRRYHRRPYGDLIDIASGRLDFVIRYENLQGDFSELLRILGIEQVRPVPVVNKSEGKENEWESYYTPDIIRQAKATCGPFMQKWGYEFPASWGGFRVSRTDRLRFHLVSIARTLYMTHFRYSDRGYARAMRLLRAHLIQ